MKYEPPRVEPIGNMNDLLRDVCSPRPDDPAVAGWVVEVGVVVEGGAWLVRIWRDRAAGTCSLHVIDPAGNVRKVAAGRRDIPDAMEGAIAALLVHGVEHDRLALERFARDVEVGT